MGKPLRLLNLTLGLVALLIAGALVKIWVAPAATTPTPAVAKPSQEPITVAFNRPARPPLAQFDVLLERNPFKQPPPAPPPRPGPTPPAAPPRPLPILSGTILVGDDWRAIVSDKGKAEIYTIGQEVGGGIITEIKEDRILLKRDDTISEVLLKGAIEPASSAAGKAPAQPPVTPPPLPAQGSPARDSFKEQLKEQKKAEKEQRKVLKKQSKNR